MDQETQIMEAIKELAGLTEKEKSQKMNIFRKVFKQKLNEGQCQLNQLLDAVSQNNIKDALEA